MFFLGRQLHVVRALNERQLSVLILEYINRSVLYNS